MKRLAIAVSLALAVGCAGRGREARAYATSHAAELVASSRPIWLDHRDSGREVPLAECPDTVGALGPSRVSASADGVFLYIDTGYADLTGVFVRHNPAFAPPDRAAPDSDTMTFELLAPEVYWFSIPR